MENFNGLIMISCNSRIVYHISGEFDLIFHWFWKSMESDRFFTNVRDTNRDDTILFVGHLFHDCNRTFGPGLRQTETNECAKRIPDRAATTSNCTPPPLLISFSSSGFFSSSLCPRLVLFSRHLLHSILPVFLPTVIHPLICRRLTIVERPPVLTIGFYISIPRWFYHAVFRKLRILRGVYTNGHLRRLLGI